MEKNTEEIELIKHKSTVGAVMLSVRGFMNQAVSFVGFFILSYLMERSQIGVFALVSELVAIFGYFSDLGMASSLVRQKEDISPEDANTAFTIQQILVILLILVAFFLYPGMSYSRNFGQPEFYIFFSLCLSFWISSFKTISMVSLERKMDFKSISVIDFFENLTFYIVVILFAFLGFGSTSYAFGVLTRSIVGLLLIYFVYPVRLKISIDKKSAKKILFFGLPFQLNSLIAVFKDRISSVFVSGIIGSDSFGIVSWAQKWPRTALSFMDSAIRVTFPMYSRLQDERKSLSQVLSRSIYIVGFLSFGLIISLNIALFDAVYIIPKYQKWQPALLPMCLFSINFLIASITTPLVNAINAIGKIRRTMAYMVMWLVLTWILYPYLSTKMGYVGVSVASIAVGLSSFVVWWDCKKYFDLNIIKIVSPIFIASAISLIIPTFLLCQQQFDRIARLFLGVCIFGISYIFCTRVFSPGQFEWMYKKIMQFSKKQT